MNPPRLQSRLSARIPVSAAALLIAAAPAVASASAPASPLHLSAHWSVVQHRCETWTRTVRVGRHHRLEHRQLRRCAEHAVSTRGHAVDLVWHQHGLVRGRLMNAGAPVADATLTITQTIPHHRTRRATVTTGPKGRYTSRITGPSGRVTVTYETVLASRRVHARGYLSLHAAHLRAGHRARFWGRVAGGFMPQDLYIELWYYAGRRDGWQPFSHLARVHRHTGRWMVSVQIPGNTRGYRYRIHATAVPSPFWPYRQTVSLEVRRRVR
jgi:hypothetical protein